MSLLKISVIVPVYNIIEYLSECIDSIMNQTYENIEIILVDDGSTDGSGDICDKYKAIDKRILVIHQQNKGVSEARNEGVKASNGDYITFVDADDCIAPTMLETLINLSENYKSDICISNQITNKPKIEAGSYKVTLYNKQEAIMKICSFQKPDDGFIPCSVCGGIYKKNVTDDISFPKDIHFYEDFYVKVLYISKASNIVVTNEPFYYYRVREGSATHTKPNYKTLSCLRIADSLKMCLPNISVKDINDIRSYFLAQCYYYYIKSVEEDVTIRHLISKEIFRNLYCVIKSNSLKVLDKMCIVSFLLMPRINKRIVGNELRVRGERSLNHQS